MLSIGKLLNDSDGLQIVGASLPELVFEIGRQCTISGFLLNQVEDLANSRGDLLGSVVEGY